MNNIQDPAQVIRHHSKSFSLAARLLPPRTRRAAEVLYAWCRACDDAIDHAPSPDQAAQKIEQMRLDLDWAYDEPGTKQHLPSPETMAFREVVQSFHIPRRYPEDMLNGFASDALGTRYSGLEDLLHYCYQVAGTVGLMMCHVLGTSDDQALPHACHLGIAMQLTNIARDVREDEARGRCYLPTSWLSSVKQTDGQLEARSAAALVKRLLEVARHYYHSGLLGIRFLDRRSACAVELALRVYRAIGDRIAQVGFDIDAGRAVVPTWHKMILAVAVVLRCVTHLSPRRVRPPAQVWWYHGWTTTAQPSS